MASDRLQLQLQISANGAQRTAAELRAIQEQVTKNSTTGLEQAKVAQEEAAKLALSKSTESSRAERYAQVAVQAAQAAADRIAILRQQLREATDEATKIEIRQQLVAAQGIKTSADLASRTAATNASALKASAKKAEDALKESNKNLERVTAQSQVKNNLVGGGLAEVAFRFNNVVGALQNLRAAATPVYDALIASNEKLNAQILSSQTNLASSVRIFKGGNEIVDPTEKIQASAGKLRAAIKQIEIDTQ